jgi:hypothetical protein
MVQRRLNGQLLSIKYACSDEVAGGGARCRDALFIAGRNVRLPLLFRLRLHAGGDWSSNQ